MFRRNRDDHVSLKMSTNNSGSSVQVNIAAESGEMGILAQHVPSIEQLKPGLVEIIEESGGSKQFFRTFQRCHSGMDKRMDHS
jgi:hypothetical protein